MKKTKRIIFIIITVLLSVVLGVVFEYKRWENNTLNRIRLKPVCERAFEIGLHHDFLLERIHTGMSKEQVEKIIGEPQNIDKEHVWAWAFRDESYGVDNRKNWIDLLDAGFMYIIFIDDKVVGNPESIYASAAQNPLEMIMGLRRCDKKTAKTLLGIEEIEFQ